MVMSIENSGALSAPEFQKEKAIMKIKILTPTVCGGKKVAKNKQINADELDARLLVSLGKAEIVKPATKDKE